jgi:hypothetical protein
MVEVTALAKVGVLTFGTTGTFVGAYPNGFVKELIRGTSKEMEGTLSEMGLSAAFKRDLSKEENPQKLQKMQMRRLERQKCTSTDRKKTTSGTLFT